MRLSLSSASLWRHAEFLALWTGQTISTFGSSITGVALPLTAVLVLHATGSEMGFLRAAQTFPALFMSLVFGVWVDRMRRRPLLIWCDSGRMILLGLIPLAAWLGWLHMEYLYVIGLLTGFLTVLFDITVTSLLPTLVPKETLVEGNSKLQVSSSFVNVLGPAAAGLLIQLITAPMAIIVDALSYLASVVSLLLIRTPEPRPTTLTERRGVWHEIMEGLGALWQIPVIRAMTIASTIGSFFLSVQQTVFALFAVRELGLSAEAFALVISSTGVAAILGALVAGPVARKLGPGPALIVGQLLSALGGCVLAAAMGSPIIALLILIGGQLLFGLGMPMYSITQISLRQAMIPDRLLGRVNASRRFLVFGVAPLGALLDGFLSDYLGLRLILALAAVGLLLSFVWVLCSPLRKLRKLGDIAQPSYFL